MINFNLRMLTQKLFVMSLFSVFIITTSCNSDDTTKAVPTPIEPSNTRQKFTLALSASPTGETKIYTQTLTDVSNNITVSYDGVGFEMPSTRTARIFSSKEGNSLFNLDYGGGRIYKFAINGGENFTQEYEKNVEFAMGTAYPRWTKASENSASIHYADGGNAERVFDVNDPKKYIRSDVSLRIMSVGLENLSFGSIEEIIIPVSDNDLKPYTINIAGVDVNHYNYVGRVDAPIIAGDKIYYGMSKSAYNPIDPCSGRGCTKAKYKNVETLVLDYPSLTNPQIIATDIAAGATNGYRTPVSHLDEKGDVYQVISVPNNQYDTHILKITNGDYDDSYNFNLSDLLGFNVASNGWFYAGNGIGYVPYANTDASVNWFSDAVWGLARVDLYNKTVVDMNMPDNLWLAQYQNAVTKDGKFYMAITPTGEDGNIYIFDTTSTSPSGYTLGASLKNLAEGTYIGIY